MTQLELVIPRRPQVLSYGGGADSFAVLLDAIERGEPPVAVAFVDVADGTAERDAPMKATKAVGCGWLDAA